MSISCSSSEPSSKMDLYVSSDDGDSLALSKEETVFLQASWIRAINTMDVGAELIIRLLNDKRSLFKSLIESQVGVLEEQVFTVDMINEDFKRAKQVGEGVVRFFSKALEFLTLQNASSKIRQMSFELGALHYKMRVWFQAENWLCVKNSLLEVILDIPSKTTSRMNLITMCAGFDSRLFAMSDKHSQRMAWTKVLQFVIRNMKKGFLAEALKTDQSGIAKCVSRSDSSEKVSDYSTVDLRVTLDTDEDEEEAHL